MHCNNYNEIYIPLCLYLYAEAKPEDKAAVINLHSTMFIFIFVQPLAVNEYILYLHSTMFIFICFG